MTTSMRPISDEEFQSLIKATVYLHEMYANDCDDAGLPRPELTLAKTYRLIMEECMIRGVTMDEEQISQSSHSILCQANNLNEKKSFTVGQLRSLLANMPDYMPVMINYPKENDTAIKANLGHVKINDESYASLSESQRQLVTEMFGQKFTPDSIAVSVVTSAVETTDSEGKRLLLVHSS